jgi:hypothetical protein
LAAGEDGRHCDRHRLGVPVTQCVNACVDPDQPPAAAPALYLGVADPDRQQLSAGDVPVLLGRDARDVYRGVISI